MAAHSDKGPSSSSRWIHCTPSAKLCADMPDQATGYAEQGTQAHSLCEFLVKEAMGVKGEDPRPGLSYYDQEMEDCCQGYRDYVMELYEEAKQETKDPVLMVEQRIQYERFVKGGFGTADCVLIADGTLNDVACQGENNTILTEFFSLTKQDQKKFTKNDFTFTLCDVFVVYVSH